MVGNFSSSGIIKAYSVSSYKSKAIPYDCGEWILYRLVEDDSPVAKFTACILKNVLEELGLPEISTK